MDLDLAQMSGLYLVEMRVTWLVEMMVCYWEMWTVLKKESKMGY